MLAWVSVSMLCAWDSCHVYAKVLSFERLLHWPLKWTEPTVVSLGPSAPPPGFACCLLLRIQIQAFSGRGCLFALRLYRAVYQCLDL